MRFAPAPPIGKVVAIRPMKSFFASLALLVAIVAPLRAQESQSMTERAFNQLLERQKELLAGAAEENPNTRMM